MANTNQRLLSRARLNELVDVTGAVLYSPANRSTYKPVSPRHTMKRAELLVCISDVDEQIARLEDARRSMVDLFYKEEFVMENVFTPPEHVEVSS